MRNISKSWIIINNRQKCWPHIHFIWPLDKPLISVHCGSAAFKPFPDKLQSAGDDALENVVRIVCFPKLKCNISSERGREKIKSFRFDPLGPKPWRSTAQLRRDYCSVLDFSIITRSIFALCFCPGLRWTEKLFFNVVTFQDYVSGVWKYLLKEGNCTGPSLWPFWTLWEMKKEGSRGKEL